ncbi:MAG: hypothetical protein SFU21_11975 [Flavihumibacter sp.]|nr:hypothetical protein [Flavihumibacter sp.]
MKMHRLFYLLPALLAFNCTPPEPPSSSTEAWVPVYAPVKNITDISINAPAATSRAGKIYAYGSYLFQNDLGTGIHVVDNSNPAAPKKIAFLQIPLCTEIAIKNGYLYTNNGPDLVVLNLANPANASFVKRIKDAFPVVQSNYPPNSGAFVCPDPSKGIVIDWVLQSNIKATCRR